jgi:membrane protein YqaA with SNARE-associated domain
MSLLLNLYNYIIRLASNAKAKYYLFILSFSESSFFPIPPDVMLLPMCMANHSRAWYFALITTVGSVLGGIFGYFIGSYSFDFIEPFLNNWGYIDSYLIAVQWFEDWGFWAVFIAGFSPIPYKVFTIAAGATYMPLIPFVIASVIGRGARFYLIALLVKVFGNQADIFIKRYIDRIGWGLVIIVALLILMYLLF